MKCRGAVTEDLVVASPGGGYDGRTKGLNRQFYATFTMQQGIVAGRASNRVPRSE
jgi:hypothetical protein